MTIVAYAPAGYHGHLVRVEVDCRIGIPGMDIVGLAASEVREARDRARVAIRNSGFRFPDRRILVNLSPADVPKIGNGFDLPIAAAILGASDQLPMQTDRPVMMVGELHLDGVVGPVRGVLAAVAEGVERGIERFIVPWRNLSEARAVAGSGAISVERLSQIPDALAVLDGAGDASGEGGSGHDAGLPHLPGTQTARANVRSGPRSLTVLSDYSQLRGLADVKRALAIAAAGGHHVLLAGPPGAGKSAAASLYPTIVQPPSREEAIEITRIHSLAHENPAVSGLFAERPFRAPHHNTSTEGLLGGRLPQIPGEVALAHGGTLFLDEALEFRRPVLQGLREPLERRRIRVARARGNYWFPAAFQLILATNLCPCGLLGRRDRACLCSIADVDRYWKRLGAPLLDRIDLRVYVAPRPLETLSATDSSEALRLAVERAIDHRTQRRRQDVCNAYLTASAATEVCALDESTQKLVAEASARFGLSTRASLSVLRVSRTIADLAGHDAVAEADVLEAISYRAYGELRPLWEPPELGTRRPWRPTPSPVY